MNNRFLKQVTAGMVLALSLMLVGCGGMVDDNPLSSVGDNQTLGGGGTTIFLPFISVAETPANEYMYGYWVEGFIRADRDLIRQVLYAYASSFYYMSNLDYISRDLTATCAYFDRATKKIHIDNKTMNDKSIQFVLAHEIAHAWSNRHGAYTYLGYESSRFVGPDFAGGWFLFNDIQGYNRCYSCAANIQNIKDCYAASSAEAALNLPPQLDPAGWGYMMALLDDDFSETVATYYGYRPTYAWVDQDLKPCSPDQRYQWLDNNLTTPPNRTVNMGPEEGAPDLNDVSVIDVAAAVCQ